MKQHLPSSHKGAFTLIELITVIAITAILMTIIVVPMIQSFTTVRSAQAFADAQDKARTLLERISREISNSAGVRDNAGDAGACDVIVPGKNGALVPVRLQYTKLDLYKPAEEGPMAENSFINPNTGRIDPTLNAPKGQILLPVAPGATIVRYWIGLRDPFRAYLNPYDGLLMPRSADRDNLYVLYRAEVQPVLNKNGSSTPNTAFFDVQNGKPVMDDPTFFVSDGSNPTTPGTKGNRIQNWRNKAEIVTEVSRYDMIAVVFNKANRQVQYDGNAPRLLPLMQFRPTRMSSEPAQGMESVRVGTESDGMDQFASSVFKTKLGAWSNTIVRTWPSGWTQGNPYQVTRLDNNGDIGSFYYDPAGGDELSTGTELFDITTYLNGVAAGGVYSFSAALNAAGLSNAAARSIFIPFGVDKKLGKIIADFGIYEVGGATYSGNNLPSKAAGPVVTPETNGATFPNGLETYTTINEQFCKLWQDHPELHGNLHRFIDLRMTPQADGTPSPLNPDPTIGFARASIVPGSEVVIGPDQSFQNAGLLTVPLVRYTRTTGTPGINQYKINYVNLAEPTDYKLLGFASNPPAVYDPTNYLSVAIQPRYKVGYIQLNSVATGAIPSGPVTVQYRFQFTKPGDSLAVDYDSRQIMSLLLTIKNFPQTSEPNPQGITLKATATVRNLLR